MKKALLSILLSLVLFFTGLVVVGASFEKDVVTGETDVIVEYTAAEETTAQAGWIKEIKIADGTEIKVPAILYAEGEVITEAVGVEGEEGYVPAVIATGVEEKVPAVLYTEGEEITIYYTEGDTIPVDAVYYITEKVDVTTPYYLVMFTRLGLGKLIVKTGWRHGLQMIAASLFAISSFFLGFVLKTKFKKGTRKPKQRRHKRKNATAAFFEEPQKRDRVKF